jgi:hypothetical protein
MTIFAKPRKRTNEEDIDSKVDFKEVTKKLEDITKDLQETAILLSNTLYEFRKSENVKS